MRKVARRLNSESLALLAILLVLLLLYNTLNLSQGRWILHPDDKNVFVFSDVLLHTGHLWYQSEYNIRFETSAFVPGLENYMEVPASEAGLRAPYSPGIFFLVCAGHLFGFKGPFVIVNLAGLMGLIFLYLTMRKLYDRDIAFLAVAFFGFSAPYVYWNNMLFTNVPALAFALGGIFFAISAIKEPEKPGNYLLSVAFFVVSVWIRYEFVILALMSMLPVVWNRKKLKPRNVAYAFVLLVALAGVVLALNYLTTGGFFGIPQKAGATATEYAVKYPTRFSGLEVLSNNAVMYVYNIAPLLTVLGCIGFLYAARREPSIYVAFFSLLGLLVFYYYGNNRKFWGYGKEWMASSYTRYFLPLFLVLSCLAAVFLGRYPRSRKWKDWSYSVLVFVVLITHIAASLSLLGRMDFGLSYTEEYMKGRLAVEEYAASLPEGSVIVDLSDAWYEKMIVSRTVFLPARIPAEARKDKIGEILGALMDDGVEVYILYNPERNVISLLDFEEMSGGFRLQAESHGITFTKGGRSPEVYRLARGDDEEAADGTGCDVDPSRCSKTNLRVLKEASGEGSVRSGSGFDGGA